MWIFDSGISLWVFGDSPRSDVHDIEVIKNEEASFSDVCVDDVKMDYIKV